MQNDYLRRRYMDDSVYRSTPGSSLGYNNVVDLRTPRYSPSAVYDDRYRPGYFDRALEDPYHRSSMASYDRGFYGYDGESRWGCDEDIRRYAITKSYCLYLLTIVSNRTNREAAVANGAISYPSQHVQLHPMMTVDGRPPTYFTVPRRLYDFLYMGEAELDRIMMAYDLGASRRRYYGGALMDRFEEDDMFRSTRSDRRRNLIALFHFLGAHRLVDHLRYRG